MPTVKKDIIETSEKINKAKKVINKKAQSLDNKILTPTDISNGPSWKFREFSHPERTIRLATVFSGIGAIEHAFQRLNLKHKIIFAGDIDEKCKKSYFANYDITENNWFSDIRNFDAKKYAGQVDILVDIMFAL
ncbi:MAG: DNA cytosine methyltransferase [Muribaculaceae bacterium]|nr:DNA cytosine methyltransferase [Muribaculaceae bacterium]